eukprot:TRINITY_DN35352_c0_g1_i2.p1 TRINITY_DN35352_c0_g1~~TRINITY_DN35352_c0_g1_i2.p1  ORF type:complete len:810 (+),score=192.77 TRINITY_DN35352_c0_g1_i2:73-2430(+)
MLCAALCAAAAALAAGSCGAAAPHSPQRRPEREAAVSEWLRRGGARSRLRLQCGAAAAIELVQDAEPDATLLAIPDSLLIPPAPRAAFAPDVDADDPAALAVGLTAAVLRLAVAVARELEKGEGSAWAAYLACLPAECAALWCAGPGTAALAGDPAVAELAAQVSRLVDSTHAGWAAEAGGAPPLPLWRRAVALALRAAEVWPAGHGPPRLVPLAAEARPAPSAVEGRLLYGLLPADGGGEGTAEEWTLRRPEARDGAGEAVVSALFSDRAALPTALQGAGYAELTAALRRVEEANPGFPGAARALLLNERGDAVLPRPSAGAIYELPTRELVEGLAGLLEAVVSAVGASGVVEHGAGTGLLAVLLAPALAARGIHFEALDVNPTFRGQAPYFNVKKESFAETLARTRDGDAAGAVWLISWLHHTAEAAVIEALETGAMPALVLVGEGEGGTCQSSEFYARSRAAQAGPIAELRGLSVSSTDSFAYDPHQAPSSTVTVFASPGGVKGLTPELLRAAFGERNALPRDRTPVWAESAAARRVRWVRSAVLRRMLPRLFDGVDLLAASDDAVSKVAEKATDAVRGRFGNQNRRPGAVILAVGPGAAGAALAVAGAGAEDNGLAAAALLRRCEPPALEACVTRMNYIPEPPSEVKGQVRQVLADRGVVLQEAASGRTRVWVRICPGQFGVAPARLAVAAGASKGDMAKLRRAAALPLASRAHGAVPEGLDRRARKWLCEAVAGDAQDAPAEAAEECREGQCAAAAAAYRAHLAAIVAGALQYCNSTAPL